MKDLKQLTCSAEAMQPGNRIMTSIQMWKVHQFNTLTAWQKMMAQQENISQDNAGYCMWKEWIIKHRAIWAEEGFFKTNFIFRTVVMPKSSFHSFLPEEHPAKSKKAVWVKLTASTQISFPTDPGNAAHHFWQACYCVRVEKSGHWWTGLTHFEKDR